MRSEDLKDKEFGPGWKGMIVASFVMLSVLTWGMSPLQKLVEKVQYKETIKAKLKVCSEVKAMVPVYEDWTSKLFASGCLWQVRNTLFVLKPEIKKQIEEEFSNQEGEYFENTLNICNSGAADMQRENQIVDMVATPIYHEKLKCPEVYKEADKLGVKLDEEVK